MTIHITCYHSGEESRNQKQWPMKLLSHKSSVISLVLVALLPFAPGSWPKISVHVNPLLTSTGHSSLCFKPWTVYFWISRKFEIDQGKEALGRPLTCRELEQSHISSPIKSMRNLNCNSFLTFLIPEVDEQSHHKEEQTQNEATDSAQHLARYKFRLSSWEKLVLVIFIPNPNSLIETLGLRALTMGEEGYPGRTRTISHF